MNTEGVIDHIVTWLDKYARNARADGFVVGVSGGIDSAVTSSLAARTGHRVICMEMPIHQATSQVSRARNHIEKLELAFPNVTSHCTELTPLFEEFINAMPAEDDTDRRLLTLANSRARLRMTTLYYMAGLHNLLVAGTGNKVEDFGVGFFTKYGDGGVDLSPIADLMKSEVYQLAEAMNVIDEIQQAAPTDGLWGDNRSDEDQMGASYPELEWAMLYDPGTDHGTLTPRQLEVLETYRNLHNTNLHKMKPIPICEIPRELKLG